MASERLIYGENSESRSPDDVMHWVGVYSELLDFKDRLLDDINRGMQSLSDPASAEIQELDVNVIEAQRARYARRLDFWTRRQSELRARSAMTASPE